MNRNTAEAMAAGAALATHANDLERAELEAAFERAARLINQLAPVMGRVGNIDFAALNEHWRYAERHGYGKDAK